MPDTGSLTSVSMTISTSRGPVVGLWRPSSVTRAVAILAPDAQFLASDTAPLLDELSARLQRTGVSALQIAACPHGFDERQSRLLAALTALRHQGVTRMALIGCGAGASMAIAAGSSCDEVTGVAVIAPDAATIEFVADLSPRRLLVLHGAADTITPATISRTLYARAGDPKELVIVPGERHDFSVHREEALDKVAAWTRSLLRHPFKPRRTQPNPVSEAPALASPVRRRDLATPGVR